MTTAIAIPERNEKALTAVEKAKSLTIVTSEDFSAADNFFVGLKALEKEVDLAYDEHISDAFKAHRNLVAKKKIYAEPIEEARRIVKGKMGIWREEQDRLREQEESRLRAEAKAQADADALKAAEVLEKQGNHEAAATVIEEASQAPAPQVKVESYVPKSSTIFSTRWSAKITNPQFVLKAIEQAVMFMDKAKTPAGIQAAANLRQAMTDIRYMVYDQVALNRQATATKDALKLGGVEFFSKKV